MNLANLLLESPNLPSKPNPRRRRTLSESATVAQTRHKLTRDLGLGSDEVTQRKLSAALRFVESSSTLSIGPSDISSLGLADFDVEEEEEEEEEERGEWGPSSRSDGSASENIPTSIAIVAPDATEGADDEIDPATLNLEDEEDAEQVPEIPDEDEEEEEEDEEEDADKRYVSRAAVLARGDDASFTAPFTGESRGGQKPEGPAPVNESIRARRLLRAKQEKVAERKTLAPHHSPEDAAKARALLSKL